LTVFLRFASVKLSIVVRSGAWQVFNEGYFGSDEIYEASKKITRDNKRIMVMKKVRMGLLTFSVLCQAVSYLLV